MSEKQNILIWSVIVAGLTLLIYSIVLRYRGETPDQLVKDPALETDADGQLVEEIPISSRFPENHAYAASARIDVGARGHNISDGIYGTCFLPKNLISNYRIPVVRWGGNTTCRYNWKNDADNGAADWYFKNRGDSIDDPSESRFVKFIDDASSAGAQGYMTLPMVGWVAKDNESYSFSVKKYGKQQRVHPRCSDAGNGMNVDGHPIHCDDPTASSLRAGPEWIAESVAFVTQRKGNVGGSGVKYWVLGNEPMLWHKTQLDVHPDRVTYDELWKRTTEYAEAIRRADPSAKIAGFCSWGWRDLFSSAADEDRPNLEGRDYQTHGLPLAEWYLRKCAEWKKQHGKPLVDVFDFHWYPQCRSIPGTPYEGAGQSMELNQLRLRAIRELWDRDYVQESWIADTARGRHTRVIPRIREWIEEHNPGMELCLGEYNYGGTDNITGGLAQAEIFGVLGREKVDLAFIWDGPKGTQHFAWQLYRNYDGNGGSFGSKSIQASSAHNDLSIYAAKREDGATTIVVINKSLDGACDLTLDAPGLKGNLGIWRFDQTTRRVVGVSNDGRVDGQISARLPVASASILVVK